jgi:hypothetical protein
MNRPPAGTRGAQELFGRLLGELRPKLHRYCARLGAKACRSLFLGVTSPGLKLQYRLHRQRRPQCGRTGVTRGKRLVVLVGQKKAVAIAVRNVLAGGVGRSWRSG